MKKTTILAALVSTAILTSALAGCTASSKTNSDSTSTPEPTSAATSVQEKLQAEQANPTGACIDGQAIIKSSESKITVPDCKQISILGIGATIELGDVEHLIIENNKNTITAKSITQIDSIGHDNTVTYGGAADAKMNDQGTGNTFTKK